MNTNINPSSIDPTKIGYYFSAGAIFRYMPTRNLNFSLLGGFGVAMVEVVEKIVLPLFKDKISDKNIRYFAKPFTQIFTIYGVSSLNPALGCGVFITLAISGFIFSQFHDSFSASTTKDFKNFTIVFVGTTFLTDSFELGLTHGALAFVAGIVCTAVTPYFKSFINNSTILTAFSKDLIVQTGLPSLKMFVTDVIMISAVSLPVGLTLATVHVIATHCFLTFLKFVRDNDYVSEALNDKNIQNMYRKIFNKPLDPGYYAPIVNELISSSIKKLESHLQF
jgi:hypothetical protein